MVLRIKKTNENRIFKVYLSAMFTLMVVRYLFKVNVPAIAFLMVTMLPIWWGTTSEQLAFMASCIPLSVAFQYKYAFLVLVVAMLFRNHWRIKNSGVFLIIMTMMVWELSHAFYGQFSFVEYLRDFAELLLLGIITSIDLHDVDYKLVIRSLAISVVGVCTIMLIMQLQQFDYNLLEVFARSAKSFRFGQSNMESVAYALNFNANNLGFICNLTICGCLMLAVRKEHRWIDIFLAICAFIFGLMTLSRSAVICVILVLGGYMLFSERKFINKIWGSICATLLAVIALFFIYNIVPSIIENILERFSRADISNGRVGLFLNYGQFIMSSPMHFLFGIGMQGIFEKVSPYYPIDNVPHMGMQEVWLAWGIVGVIMMLMVFWKIIITSKRYACGKRTLYQFAPLALTVLFTMTGQLLTSSRALLALSFAYICLCVKKDRVN